MKVFLVTNALVAAVAAFPTALDERQLPGAGLSQTFSEKQLISVSGIHKFVAPGPGDQRGPCPGLNALANHGYLPHNGVGTIAQYTAATNQVFGLGLDIAGVFAAYGALSSGDGDSWSLGGPPDQATSLPLGNLQGKPKGISFSHNEYEGDASATRDDFYESGNDYKLNMGYFKELYNILPATSFATLSAHRNTRIQNSVHQNPYFFNGPFTGIGVAGAANSFVWRLAANHSARYPQGYLDKYTFATLWSVYGTGKDMYWKPGHDRIPENWYRRPFDDEYDFPFAFKDLGTYIASHPRSGKVGGNTGKVNTFTGLDVTNFTGGVFSAETLAQGNNAGCFAYQTGQLLAPDLASKLFKNVEGPLAMINKAFNDGLAPLGCPQLKSIDKSELNKYPGYRHPKAHA